jgi:predicted TPR repeat methyltransferase
MMTNQEKQEWVKLALKHQQEGKFLEAASAYQQILAQEPDDAHALSSLGILCRQGGRNDLAIGFAGRAVQVNPASAIYQHNYGEAWLAIGEPEQAMLAFGKAIALQPNRPEPCAGMGIALQHRGRWSESVDLLRKAIERGLHSAGIHVDLAKALMRLGKLDEADDALQKARAIQPDLPEIWQVSGEILGHRRKYAQALEAFGHAKRLAPRYARPHHGAGVVRALQGDFDAAADDMRRALELDPNYPEAHCGLGAILLRKDQVNDAIASYERALALRPAYLEARADLALAYEKAGRLKDAAGQYAALAQATADESLYRFQQASLGQGDAPPAAPPALVARLFDKYAGSFDEHLTRFLGYRAPQLVSQAVARANPHAHHLDILDLGCGTGLCGQLLKPLARTLVGIDLSSAMIDKARERGIYDELVVGDIHDISPAGSQRVDLVTSCDVFCYLGDLAPIFRKVAAMLRPGGLFAFTVEAMDEGTYLLRQTRRYTHSPTYIRELARGEGYELISLDRTVLRTERQQDVEGLVIVLKCVDADAVRTKP